MLLANLLLASALAASPPSPAPRESMKTASFSFRLIAEPETLDWNRAHTTVETHLLMNLMEGLMSFDEKMQPKPALAEKWSRSANGLDYQFHLRPGLKWSDGMPLTTKDFLASWRRLLDPATGAAYAYLLFDITGAEGFNRGTIRDFSQVGVKAPDDLTLTVRLTRPVAHWIQILTFWVTFPIRQDLIDRHGPSWTDPGKLVTNGPFILAERQPDSKVVLKANPLYAGPRGNLREATGWVVREDSTALKLYDSGRLDALTDLPAIELAKLRSRADFRVFPYLKTVYLGFVLDRLPVSEVRARRAIAMAIDKSRFGEILGGGQAAATSFVPEGMPGFETGIGLPFDPAKAKAELASARFDPETKLDWRIVTLNAEKPLAVAQYLQAELKRHLGVELAIDSFDNKTFRSRLDLKTTPIFLLSWSADYPDPDNFLSVFLKDSGNNRTAWKRLDYDENVLGARATSNAAVRSRSHRDALRILLEQDVVIVPLYYEPNSALVKQRVSGFRLNPLNYLFLRDIEIGEPAS